ncbi:MAG: Holliday junction resolvase RuvX [Myxococcota bacterium]
MRVLGLDLGQRRIGLALTDASGGIAMPAGALDRKGLEADLRWLRDFSTERDVGEIVVGLPIHMSGRLGPEAERARAFARRLEEVTQLPVELLDERWTTLEAERALRETGHSTRSSRKVVDSVAATILLRTYLARREHEDRPE